MKEIFWKAPLHIHTEKGQDWYWIVSIITITIAVISIVFNNILFAILILVGVFTMMLYSSKKPDIVSMSVSDKGVRINDLFYYYDKLESFWIEDKDLLPRILLRSKNKFSFHITMLLPEDADVNSIRNILLEHIEEEKMSEPFIEKLLIYFGF